MSIPLLESSTASDVLDELDHLLITALQTSPRARWEQIGAAVGVEASTAARRWKRLTEAGHAWMSCHPAGIGPTPPTVAVIEVDCVSGRLHEVAAAIVDDPHLITIDHVTGSRDLVLTAAFPDQAALARYVGLRLEALPGVAATRSQIASTVHAVGSRWRLDRLAPGSRKNLAQDASGGSTGIGRGLSSADDLDHRLLALLAQDCRQSVAALARSSGASASTVRRRLDRFHRADALVYRCEVARCLSGWPVAVTFWGVAPPDATARITAQLVTQRETRLCASLSGPHNLLLTVWLRSVEDLPSFEARLYARFPELTVADRAVTLWPLKLAGQILDPRGRRIRGVPVAFWHDPAAERSEADLIRRLATPRAEPAAAHSGDLGRRSPSV
ncbi:Lrp/AsnC family transcriptional regulator [Streptomyces sp. NK15101]|uniref:Lrp/AsnC family transcriptional regulator n=1 Tax=Streptomyces sp. NK15101 TaxID=2873261 RepID=UPI001CEDFE47|nr:Lrp/AsnC family transcriptional regulator [Streptomyces sp. NK15101]